MGDEGKPGKKLKVKGKVKRLERPPDNPVVDVSLCVCLCVFLCVCVCVCGGGPVPVSLLKQVFMDVVELPKC